MDCNHDLFNSVNEGTDNGRGIPTSGCRNPPHPNPAAGTIVRKNSPISNMAYQRNIYVQMGREKSSCDFFHEWNEYKNLQRDFDSPILS